MNLISASMDCTSRLSSLRTRFSTAEIAFAPARHGVEPIFTVYQGDDPVAYVISLNLRRRHLNESQRALVAAKLATLRDGQRADLVEGLPIGRASGMLNVGERTVARAREVLEHGAPELVSAVEHGKISVSATVAHSEPGDNISTCWPMVLLSAASSMPTPRRSERRGCGR
jgi:hypothetical protein